MTTDQGSRGLEVALARRLAFEEMVLGISAELVGVRSDALDGAVTGVLDRLGRFIGTGRAYVFRFSPDRARLSATHEACAPGVPSALVSFRDVPVADLGWGMQRVQRGETVEVPSAAALPPEAAPIAEAMRRLGISSFVTIPMRAAGDVIGGVGFDWMTEVGGASDADVLRGLRITAEILAGVLTRAGAERALLATEERLRSFIATTSDGVCCFELPTPAPDTTPAEILFERFLSARLVDCNLEYARLHEAAREDLIGRTWRQIALTPIDPLRDLFEQLLERGSPSHDHELSRSWPDGSVTWMRVRAQLVKVDGRVVRLWGILRDITDEKRSAEERKSLEAQLQHAQRLESIGILAGGVAHDFNNILTVVLNCARSAREVLRADPAGAEDALDDVIDAAARAAELTRGLLTFGRRQVVKRVPVDCNALIEDLVGMLRRLIRASVELDFVPGHALGVINADRGQMQQLLINLCVNAAEAIEDVGRVTIETENVKLNGAYVKAHPWARPGRYVLLTVSDTGVGMPAEIRDRIFEPFFTTKELGKGTGLGLAIVYGIVKEHEGMIHAYSEPGRGTTFKIYLPIVEREASSVGLKVEGRVRGGHETILVAEDHERVAHVVTTSLERAGYRIVRARDGRETVRVFSERAAEINLVLLDAVMPLVSGQEVYRTISTLRPEVPILVASGYAGPTFAAELPAARPEDFIAKPYDVDHLLRRIREALDVAASRGA